MPDVGLVFIELGTVVALIGMYALAKYTLTSDDPYYPKRKLKDNREAWEILAERDLDARAREPTRGNANSGGKRKTKRKLKNR